MKRLFILLAFVASCAASQSAFAHSEGHGPEVTMTASEIIPTATDHVKSLVDQQIQIEGIGKLDAKWLSVPEFKKKVVRSVRGYHVVGFADATGEQTLFLLMSRAGDLYNVNFSGNFKEIK